MDNLGTHRTLDALFRVLAHPRWEVVFQGAHAAHPNLAEPWWKILHPPAPKGEVVRELGEGVRAGRDDDVLPEHPPPSVCLGATSTLPRRMTHRRWLPSRCRTNLPDDPPNNWT